MHLTSGCCTGNLWLTRKVNMAPYVRGRQVGWEGGEGRGYGGVWKKLPRFSGEVRNSKLVSEGNCLFQVFSIIVLALPVTGVALFENT